MLSASLNFCASGNFLFIPSFLMKNFFTIAYANRGRHSEWWFGRWFTPYTFSYATCPIYADLGTDIAAWKMIWCVDVFPRMKYPVISALAWNSIDGSGCRLNSRFDFCRTLAIEWRIINIIPGWKLVGGKGQDWAMINLAWIRLKPCDDLAQNSFTEL